MQCNLNHLSEIKRNRIEWIKLKKENSQTHIQFSYARYFICTYNQISMSMCGRLNSWCVTFGFALASLIEVMIPEVDWSHNLSVRKNSFFESQFILVNFFTASVYRVFFLVNSLNCLFFRSQIQAKSENVLVYIIFKWNMNDINNNKAIKSFQRAIVRAFVDNIDCVCSLDYLSKTAIKKGTANNYELMLKPWKLIRIYISSLAIITVGLSLLTWAWLLLLFVFFRCVSLVFGAF